MFVVLVMISVCGVAYDQCLWCYDDQCLWCLMISVCGVGYDQCLWRWL